jgi:putative intracellular protease/amidase
MAEIYRTLAFLPLARTRARRHARAMRCEVLLYDGFDELDALGPWEVLSDVGRVRDDVDAALVTLDGGAPVRASHGAVITPHRALSEHVDLLVAAVGTAARDRAPGARSSAASCPTPSAPATRTARWWPRSAPVRCCSPPRVC